MKTMNYLFTAAFVLLLGACTNENQSTEVDLQVTEFRAAETQEVTIYLELDLHQMALEYELSELHLELVRIEEEIENSDGFEDEELQRRLERVQRMIDENRFDFERNSEVISDFRRGPRGPRGPGRPGNPCGEEGNERCDLDLENATIYVFAREEIDIKTTRDDETCGELVDLVEVPEYEVRVQEAVLESEEGCADEIKFSGVNAEGKKFTYSLPLAH